MKSIIQQEVAESGRSAREDLPARARWRLSKSAKENFLQESVEKSVSNDGLNSSISPNLWKMKRK